ncbi:MAG: phage terminase large subunit [Solirubrobacterales bacterium]
MPAPDFGAAVRDRLASMGPRGSIHVPYPQTWASPAHRRFFESESAELLGSGQMGSGKSRVLVEKAWWLGLSYPGAELGIIRKVHKDLALTTERTFWTEVARPDLIVRRNATEHWVDFGSRSKPSRIWFLGLDHDPNTGQASKIGSANLDWAGVDEAIQLDESDWIMVGGRLRRQTLPYRQLAAVTNPAWPKHWLKLHFDGQPEREYLDLRDNAYLPADYLARLASMGGSPDALRLARGLWVVGEGVIWVLPEAQVGASAGPFRHVHGAIDWGFVHPFACEVIGETGLGKLAVIDEVYERGKTVGQLIPVLRYLRDAHKVETFYADPSEPGAIAECRAGGLKVEPANNDVAMGIGAVGDAIRLGMTVDPACTGLLNEMPGYTWQPQHGGGFREVPIEINDDACDALRYGVMSFRNDPSNPWAGVQSFGGVV